MITFQEGFNKVWQHFIVEQNLPGFDNLNCVYNQNGLKCAIGILVPEEKEKFLVEGCSLLFQPMEIKEEFQQEPGAYISFWERLQNKHDNTAIDYKDDFHSHFMRDLVQLAKKYNLKILTLP